MAERTKEVRVLRDGALRAIQTDDGRHIEGRAIVYDSPSEDLGGFTEVIKPGALRLDPDLRAFFDHQSQYVIGRTTAGTLKVIEADDGVYMSAEPPDTQWARDLLTSIDRGDINGMSFGFYVTEDEWEKDGDGVLRTITGGDVFELSVVAMPAYPQTSAEARDMASALAEPPEPGSGEDDETDPGSEDERPPYIPPLI